MKKKKLFLLSILLICFFMFNLNIRVSAATAMYVRCTPSFDGSLPTLSSTYYSGSDDFSNYNSFALIDAKESNETRHLSFAGGRGYFFEYYGPTLTLYKDNSIDPTGTPNGRLCWYNELYTDEDGAMAQCDSENWDNYVSKEKLYLGEQCPSYVMQTTGAGTAGAILGDFVVLAGQKSPSAVETITSDKMIIYGAKDSENGTKMVIIEVYGSDGKYGFVSNADSDYSFHIRLGGYPANGNGDPNDILDSGMCGYSFKYLDWAAVSQVVRIAVMPYDKVPSFFKITEPDKYPETLLVGLPAGAGCEGHTKYIYEDNETFERIFYDPSLNKISSSSVLEEWYKQYSQVLDSDIKIISKFKSSGNNGYADLVKEAEEVKKAVENRTNYNFSKFSPTEFIEKISIAVNDLKLISGELPSDVNYKYKDRYCNDVSSNEYTMSHFKKMEFNPALGSAMDYFNCAVFGKADLNEYEYSKNSEFVGEILLKYVSNVINSYSGNGYDITQLNKDVSYYIELFSTVIGYINGQGLVEGNRGEEVFNELQKLATDFGFQVVIDCKSLLGEEVIARVKKYIDILKVAIPILLIGFGVLDFSKALFSGDDDKMKQSQKTFLKRILIAILFYFTPIFVKLLLDIANNVWQFISPTSCGLF